MKTYLAKNYLTRESLEKDIINDTGQTTDLKESIIEGTEKELSNLQLSKKSITWGVKTSVKDNKEEKTANDKINRGEIFISGINLK